VALAVLTWAGFRPQAAAPAAALTGQAAGAP
jgi:hypothetical protein